jgi:aspartate racemase
MKTLGLIGGTTWVSTVDYYRYINQLTIERLGGLNSARLLLYSLNFRDAKSLADVGDWESLGKLMSGIARNLETAGAEAIVLCANTMHIVADLIQSQIEIPLIHITDATAKEIRRKWLNKVALLGTRFTMDNDFYKERLTRFEIETLIPTEEQRDFIHSSIFEELGKDVFRAETKQRFLDVIEDLAARGAEGVILGCTEIPMLIKPDECPVPSFDTTLIHAKAAVEFALS